MSNQADRDSVTSHCYADLVSLLRQSQENDEKSKKAADAIESLVAELRALVEEVERHGDYDPQYGIGAALDRACSIGDQPE